MSLPVDEREDETDLILLLLQRERRKGQILPLHYNMRDERRCATPRSLSLFSFLRFMVPR